MKENIENALHHFFSHADIFAEMFRLTEGIDLDEKTLSDVDLCSCQELFEQYTGKESLKMMRAAVCKKDDQHFYLLVPLVQPVGKTDLMAFLLIARCAVMDLADQNGWQAEGIIHTVLNLSGLPNEALMIDE